MLEKTIYLLFVFVRCSENMLENVRRAFSNIFSVVFLLLILNLHRNDIGFYKKIGKKIFAKFFFSNFDQNNVRCSLDTRILMLVLLDVRICNTRKCSCSKMLENPRSYSPDTRKICVRHNNSLKSDLKVYFYRLAVLCPLLENCIFD